MRPFRERISIPLLAAMLAVGLLLGGLLVGYEPVGADPDLMYRPIKSELARALRAGALPFWSDRFGLGVPLVAESHAAAFYPPNWVAYRVLGVPPAYRLMMWLHCVALVGTTYAYARQLGLTDWGAALAGVSFTLCGFQAIHSGHEPFYHILPYLPLCLLLAEQYAAGGRIDRLALLGLAWAAQLTLGHFQIQFWTGTLVLLVGGWRVVTDRRPWSRAAALAAGLAWGAAIAAPQLALTRELTEVSGFDRPFTYISNYAFPPAHWAQPALPLAYTDLAGGPESAYWKGTHMTTGAESCLYVGTVPLILAAVGLAGRDRTLAPWKWAVAASLAVATMPRWWLDGYWLLTRLPGFGYFRCPTRYTAITSLGLALLAGRGLDRALPARRFRDGLVLAIAFGAAAFAWSAWWWQGPEFRKFQGEGAWPALRFGSAAAAWAIGLVAVVAWRRGRIGAWGPIAATLVELGALYYRSQVCWGWSVPFPEGSPIVSRLAREPDVGLIAGRLEDLAARAGLTAAYPYLGITPPPPNYLLESTWFPDRSSLPNNRRWMQRFGVTHGVWWAVDETTDVEAVAVGDDPALDRLLHGSKGEVPRRSWKLVRYAGAMPAAWVAQDAVVIDATDENDRWPKLATALAARDPARREAIYLRDEAPPAPRSPRARSARLRSWDGRTATVEHDGACDLVLRRTYYPGWTARVDEGPARTVFRVNGGLQAVRLDGAGVSRVELQYRPTGLRPAAGIAMGALAAAVTVLGPSLARARRDASRRAGEAR
jgi:hypothetical protein